MSETEDKPASPQQEQEEQDKSQETESAPVVDTEDTELDVKDSEIEEDLPEDESKDTSDNTFSKLREKTYMPDKADTQRECACSDQDFVRLIATDSSVLCKTINRWQQSYKLDVDDLKEKALRLMKGDFRDLYGDLDPKEQEKIEAEIARLQRERTELLMGAIDRLTKENTLT